MKISGGVLAGTHETLELIGMHVSLLGVLLSTVSELVTLLKSSVMSKLFKTIEYKMIQTGILFHRNKRISFVW